MLYKSIILCCKLYAASNKLIDKKLLKVNDIIIKIFVKKISESGAVDNNFTIYNMTAYLINLFFLDYGFIK